MQIIIFFFSFLFCLGSCSSIENCSQMITILSNIANNHEYFLTFASEEPCLLNKNFTISQNLTISGSQNVTSNWIFSENSQLFIEKNSYFELNHINIEILTDNNKNINDFRALPLFTLQKSAMIQMKNVSFNGILPRKIVYGKEATLFLLYCVFNRVQISSRAFHMKNFSNVIIINSSFSESSFGEIPFIFLESQSFLHISGFEIANSKYLNKTQESTFFLLEDSWTFLKNIRIKNSVFSKGFLEITGSSQLLTNFTYVLQDFLVSNCTSSHVLLVEISSYLWNSMISLEDCVFFNNTANFSFLSLSHVSVSLYNCNFSMNYVNFATIYAREALLLNIENVKFAKQNVFNETLLNEAAFFSTLWSGSCLILENILVKSIKNLTITHSFAFDSTVGIQFHDSPFVLNKLSQQNSQYSSIITINESTFLSNYVFYRRNLNISGVLLINSESDIFLNNCLMKLNIIDSIAVPEKNIGGSCLNSFTFDNNLRINGSIFANNSAKFISNCIYFSGAHLQITFSVFDANTPLIGPEISLQYKLLQKTFVRILEALPYGFSGALHFRGEILTIISSYISNNQGYIGGGLLLGGSDSQRFLKFTVKTTIFQSNSAGTMGGGLYFTPGIHTLQGNISESFFLQNDARYGGGLSTEYSFSEDFLQLDHIVFFANRAQYCGGLLLHHIQGSLRLCNSVLLENRGFLPPGMTLPILGGAFGLWGSAKTLGISENNYFFNNSADINGGAIGMLGCFLQSFNDVFEGNSAKFQGSLFWISNAEIHFTNATIFDHKSQGIATGFGYEYSVIYLKNVNFSNNFAAERSGLFEIFFDSSLIAIGIKVKETASFSGGIMNFFDNYVSEIQIIDSVFSSNYVENDYLFDVSHSKIAIKNCSFTDNRSPLFGVFNSSLDLFGNSFTNHHCTKLNSIEGCVFETNLGSLLKFEECKFEDISSDFYSTLAIFTNSYVNFSKTLMKNITASQEQQAFLIKSSNISIFSSEFQSFSPCFFDVLQTNFTISNTKLRNSRENDGFSVSRVRNMIKFEDSSFIKIFLCEFDGNDAITNGSILNIRINSQFPIKMLMIEGSIFSNGRSFLNGGAIYLYNANISIKNCYFLNNSAENHGGAIFSETSFENFTRKAYFQGNNYFSKNEAKIGGGAIMWVKTLPFIEDNSINYQENKAAYGEKIASEVLRVFVNIYDKNTGVLEFSSMRNQSKLDYFIESQKPGKTIDKTIILLYCDYYNQTIRNSAPFLEALEIIPADTENLSNISGSFPTYLSKQIFSLQNGEINISNIEIFTYPSEKTLYIRLKSSIIPSFSAYLVSLLPFETKSLTNSSYSLEIPVKIIACTYGEVTLSSTCYQCPNDKFSLTPSASSCDSCPNTAKCPGGSSIDVNPGYWRIANTSLIFFCEMNAGNCLGGRDSECAGNFIGPLCRSCPQGYYDLKECVSCDSFVWNVFRVIGCIVLMVILVIILVKSAIENTRLYDRVRTINKCYKLSEHMIKEHLDIQSTFMKILVNYLQMSAFLQVIPLLFLGFLEDYFDIITVFTSISAKFIAFDCLFLDTVFEGTRLLKFACTCLLPFILILLAFLGFYIDYRIRKNKGSLLDKLFSTVFGVYFMMLSNVVQESLRSLSCIEIEPSVKRLKYKPISICDSEYIKEQYLIVWPLFISFSLLVPAITFTYLYYKRENLYESRIFNKFNFIYFEYKTKYFYWDMIILIKKFLASIITLFSMSPRTKILLLLLLVLSYTLFFHDFQPYLNQNLNKLEFLANIALILAIFINAILNELGKNHNNLQFFLNIGLFLTNVTFFFAWSSQFLRYIFRKYKSTFQRKFPKIFNSFQRLHKFYCEKIINPLKATIEQRSKKIMSSLRSISPLRALRIQNLPLSNKKNKRKLDKNNKKNENININLKIQFNN